MKNCKYCNQTNPIKQDCDNGYYLEVDVEQEEISMYDENDNCLASMSVEYCPMCGRKLYNTYLAIQHKSVKNCNKPYNSMDFHNYLNAVFAQTKRR